MMVITLEDIQQIFTDAANGHISLEDVDRWAWKRVEADDFYMLEYQPKKDQDIIWDYLLFLFGVDLKHNETDYMHPAECLPEVFENIWKRWRSDPPPKISISSS